MKVGFSGSRTGATAAQLEAIKGVLRQWGASELHHGDAVGADALVHAVAVAEGLRTVAHPPTKPGQRSFCAADEIREVRSYMARNRAIVDETMALLAAPVDEEQAVRASGTWRTVRYARSLGRPVVIAWASGVSQWERVLDMDGSPLAPPRIDPLVSREQAATIASGFLEKHPQWLPGAKVGRVVDLEDIRLAGWRRPLLYGVRTEDPWIAYVDRGVSWIIRSSDVIAIDKITGEVLYHGSACDEG